MRSTLAKGSERYFQNKFQQGQINILKILRGLSFSAEYMKIYLGSNVAIKEEGGGGGGGGG